MQRADLVPVGGVLGEIALRRVGMLALDRGKMPAVAHERGVVPVGARQKIGDQTAPRGVVGKAVEHPRAFRVAVDEAGLGEELQVARDARLRLAEDGGEVLHRQLGLGQQRQDAQARALARGFQRGKDGIDGKRRRNGGHERSPQRI